MKPNPPSNKNERYIAEQSEKIEQRIKRREENINRRFDRIISHQNCSTTVADKKSTDAFDINKDEIKNNDNNTIDKDNTCRVEDEEEFNRMSAALLTAEDEADACNSFQDILVDNFNSAEDASEEWLSNESLEDAKQPLKQQLPIEEAAGDNCNDHQQQQKKNSCSKPSRGD